MNDDTVPFPPFASAKPKKPQEPEPGDETRKRKKRKPSSTTVPLYSLVAFAGLTTEEIAQIVRVCEAINTFPKGSRKRIAAAVGQLFS
jgi:hypothetical protein